MDGYDRHVDGTENNRGDYPSILLVGSSGTGKTMLAKAVEKVKLCLLLDKNS